MDHSFAELDFQNNPLVHYSDGYFEFLKLVFPNSKFDKILLLENGEKKGFFNYVTHHNDAYGTVLNSLPFFGSHGGPIASNNFFKEKLIEKIKLNLSEINLASCTIIESPFYPLTNRDIQELGVSEVDYRIGQFTLLPADMPHFHVKTRNSIRKGQKLKMIIQKRNDHESWEWMRCVHESSILSLNGIPKSKSVFDSLKSALNKSVDLWVGSIENKPVCGLVTISYNQTVEYFTPVVETNFRDSQALSALIYEVILIASKNGFKLWNWGGTWQSQTGVYRFKSRWGAKDIKYRYFNSVNSESINLASQEELITSYPFFYVRKF